MSAKLLPARRENLALFDTRPIALEGFTLTARGLTVSGRPTPQQWLAAMDFAMAAEECSPFWVGELWNYAEGRHDWVEKLEQLLGSLGRPLQLKTLQNHGAIAKSLTPAAKALAPTIGHGDAVASLAPDEQVAWLDKARTEEMGIRDLRVEIRASKRRRILAGQATLKGMYRVLYADPPWLYGDRPPSGRGASDAFPPMTIADICKLPVEAHSLPNAVLFMWVTAPMLYENPGPREVVEAWGFKAKTGMVWDKVVTASGHYVQSCHEHLIIATRGSCLPDNPTPSPDSVVVERRTHAFEHSEKPAVFRKVIERLYTTGPYLELFGREQVEGWQVFGNDARLWAEEVSA